MKTVEETLTELGIGYHLEENEERVAFWPQESGQGGIVVQAKEEDLIVEIIRSFQCMYMAHKKSIPASDPSTQEELWMDVIVAARRAETIGASKLIQELGQHFEIKRKNLKS